MFAPSVVHHVERGIDMDQEVESRLAATDEYGELTTEDELFMHICQGLIRLFDLMIKMETLVH